MINWYQRFGEDGDPAEYVGSGSTRFLCVEGAGKLNVTGKIFCYGQKHNPLLE